MRDREKIFSFSQNWLAEDRASDWRVWLRDYVDKPDVEYLEIGAFEGRTLFWVLQNILTHSTCRAVAVDIFPFEMEKILRHNLNVAGLQNKVNIFKGASEEILRGFRAQQFDIIYIDGAHNVRSVMTDAVHAYFLLKNDGILIFDDCIYQPDRLPIDLQPKTVTDLFVLGFGESFEILKYDDQLVFKKNDKINSKSWWDSKSYFGDYEYEWYRRCLTCREVDVFLTQNQSATLEAELRFYNKLQPDASLRLKRLIEIAQKLHS